MDRAVASASLLLASPVILARAAAAYAREGRVLNRSDVVGKDGHPFTVWTFADHSGGFTLLHLVAVARGDMRFIGPRPLSADQAAELSSQESWRLEGEPGLFSAHRLQSSTGIAYGAEHQLDAEHFEDPSLANRANLGLIARSILAGILGGAEDHHEPDHFAMLGVSIANTTMQGALDWIEGRARRDPGVDRGSLICFVNPGSLNIAVGDADYRRVLHDADLVLPDGIGIRLATRMKGIGLKENVNGTDMFPRLCERAAAQGFPIYLLGARQGVAEAAGQAMVKSYPDLVVAGTHNGYITRREEEVIAHINDSGARILLVAMGVPTQELWLDRSRSALSPGVLMGVGGLFDFYSGRIPRAPLWLREIGMEWVWRLVQEPRRMWRRYIIGNPLFLFRVWRDRRADADQTPTGADG